MNFSIPFGASQEAIKAVVQRGVDVMCEQEAVGETADVAFLFDDRAEDGEEEGEEWNKDEENDENTIEERNRYERNNKRVNNHTITTEDWANGKEEEFVAKTKRLEFSLGYLNFSQLEK
jgi:hypothetical protein